MKCLTLLAVLCCQSRLVGSLWLLFCEFPHERLVFSYKSLRSILPCFFSVSVWFVAYEVCLRWLALSSELSLSLSETSFRMAFAFEVFDLSFLWGSKQQVALGQGQHLGGLTGEQLTVGEHFIGLWVHAHLGQC